MTGFTLSTTNQGVVLNLLRTAGYTGNARSTVVIQNMSGVDVVYVACRQTATFPTTTGISLDSTEPLSTLTLYDVDLGLVYVENGSGVSFSIIVTGGRTNR